MTMCMLKYGMRLLMLFVGARERYQTSYANPDSLNAKRKSQVLGAKCPEPGSSRCEGTVEDQFVIPGSGRNLIPEVHLRSIQIVSVRTPVPTAEGLHG